MASLTQLQTFWGVKLLPGGLLGRVGHGVSPQFGPGCMCTAHSEQTVPLVVKLCEATCLHLVKEARTAMVFLRKTIFSTRMAHAGQESIAMSLSPCGKGGSEHLCLDLIPGAYPLAFHLCS